MLVISYGLRYLLDFARRVIFTGESSKSEAAAALHGEEVDERTGY
jgi:hypothetical protein